MTSKPSNPDRISSWLVAALGLATVVVWPLGSHLAWRNATWPLHGLPAFFLGLVAFVALTAVARLFVGAARHGRGWLVGRSALRTAAAAAALLASTVILFYSVELWRGKRAWAVVAATAERQGESLDPRSLIPSPVSADEDLAAAPLFAPLESAAVIRRDAAGNLVGPYLGPLTNVTQFADRLSRYRSGIRLAQWMEGESTDLAAWLKACSPPGSAKQSVEPPPRQELAAALLQVLAPFDGMIGELRTFGDRPACRLAIDYELPYFSEFHAERVLMTFTRILGLRATAKLALAETEAACEDLALALRLADHLRPQPTLGHQRTRAFAFADLLQPLWEGMRERRWNSAQLEALQRELKRFRPIEDSARHTRFVMLANAGFCEAIVPTTPSQPDTAAARLSVDGREFLGWVRRFYPVGWSLQDQAVICRLGLDRLSTIAAGGPLPLAGEWAMSRELMRGTSDPFFPVFVAPRVSMTYLDHQESLLFAESVARLAELACALERHRLAQGQYPETPEAVVPTFIPELPSDPASRGPFHYTRQGDQGFILYSVGADGVDDHGRFSLRRWHEDGEPDPEPEVKQNDWVWSPTSTRPAEVR